MTLKSLPPNYIRVKSIELSRDKSLARRIDIAALGIAVVMAAAGLAFVPFSSFVYLGVIDRWDVVKLAVLIPAIMIYTLLHEVLHAACMKSTGGVKAVFGMSRLMPYAACGAYFDREDFIRVTLLPTAAFMLLYLVLGLILPTGWFWFAYILQIVNISGAACDLYAVWIAAGMPTGALVCDSGICTEFYMKAELVEK